MRVQWYPTATPGDYHSPPLPPPPTNPPGHCVTRRDVVFLQDSNAWRNAKTISKKIASFYTVNICFIQTLHYAIYAQFFLVSSDEFLSERALTERVSDACNYVIYQTPKSPAITESFTYLKFQ